MRLRPELGGEGGGMAMMRLLRHRGFSRRTIQARIEGELISLSTAKIDFVCNGMASKWPLEGELNLVH